jgi:KipI family sensor histidine kinase inhibitor
MRFIPAGDSAVVVEFGDGIDRALSERVLALARALRAAAPPGVVDVVPTFRSLLVHYDPLVTGGKDVVAAIHAVTEPAGDRERPRRRWTIPACYAAQLAPDLAEVAQRTGLAAEDVGARHASTEFHVYMIGFAPGHPYMGDLPGELALPRRTDPRLRVPAGSIAIASTLSVIHPIDNPTGWHVIGATPIRLFDPTWEQPSLLAPGDAVRFAPVGLREFETIRSAVEAKEFTPISEELPP